MNGDADIGKEISYANRPRTELTVRVERRGGDEYALAISWIARAM
jgi:hypothetical protein